jgi:hypothetical protein
MMVNLASKSKIIFKSVMLNEIMIGFLYFKKRELTAW